MNLHNYTTILHRQDDSSWVAEIPVIPGWYALMPAREEALAELADVFRIIAAEYREKHMQLPADTTEIVHALCHGTGIGSIRAGPVWQT